MAKYLTKKQVVKLFRENRYRYVENETIDIKKEAWLNTLKHYRESNLISESQLNKWVYPKELL